MNLQVTELDALIERALLEVEMSAPATRATPVAPTAIAPTVRLRFSDDLQFNDCDNGTRLVQAFGASIRYCYEQMTWFVWTGKYWMPNGEPLLQEMMKDVADELWVRSREQSNPTLARWAGDLKSSSDIRNAIAMASSEPAIAAKHSDFNQDTCLLNFTNGTLNLETGKFYAHTPSDMLTKMVDFANDKHATCPLWLKFLDEVFPNEHAAIIPFLQAAIGYSLSGLTKERCLFLLHGVGANGKSVFLDVIKTIFGEYAKTASWTSFTQKRGSHPEDIAQLAGARFVSATESAKDVKLEENLLKQVTGGTDNVSARPMYGSRFEYRPQFKLWLATNHKPTVSTDMAIWDRLRLIPFTVRFEESQQDKNLATTLKLEAAGIMNWAVAGFQQYQLTGLPIIPEIEIATSAYQAEQDEINSFMSAKCILKDDAECKRADLFKAYTHWAMQEGEKCMTKRDFNERIRERGLQEKHTEDGDVWTGVGLTILIN